MLNAEIIEPLFSDSNSIVMVEKTNGKYMFCLDFWKVSNIVNGLHFVRNISTIDLSNVYFQIPLAKES